MRKSRQMMSRMFALIFLSLPILSFANNASLEMGEELYDEFCSGCHGDNAAGLTQFKDDLEMFVERLEGITQNMPDFAGVFEEDEIEAIFNYLEQSTSLN
ncbi:MAG: cytochrome c [Pseudomonadota bacterium]|nr:cytochrome c [Pseudomonadota bacterium]